MFEYLRKVLVQNNEDQLSRELNLTIDECRQKKLHIAAASLFIEIAKADGDFTEAERKRIIELMEKEFNLDEECAKELIELSKKKVDESISVYEFSTIINEHFKKEEKLKLLKNLWKVIYEDRSLDQYEDRLIKIIGATLNLNHKDVIASKLAAKEELGF